MNKAKEKLLKKMNLSSSHSMSSPPCSTDTEWVLLPSEPSSDEEKIASGLKIKQSDKKKDEAETSNNVQNHDCCMEQGRRDRSQTESSAHQTCCSGCRSTILSLNEKVALLEKQVKFLETKQVFTTAPVRPSMDGSRGNFPRPQSEPALIMLHVDVADLELFNYRTFRRKKKNSNRRHKTNSLIQDKEIETMNTVQSILAETIYGDDVYKFVRHFHASPERLIADMEERLGSYQRFNYAFSQLKKLGKDLFNPDSITQALIDIQCQSHAETLKRHLATFDSSLPPATPQRSPTNQCSATNHSSFAESTNQQPSENILSNQNLTNQLPSNGEET